jgi:hypothetical protein
MYSTTGDDLDNRDNYFSSTEPTPIGKFDDGGYLIIKVRQLDFVITLKMV